MSSLKQKTIKGVLWSGIDSFATQGITFVIGIILARLLTPAEFGLIGMITIFISISQAFIDSGFSNALIRKKECTSADFSTVFYFNFAVGLLFFLILYISAPFISAFFNEPQLTKIVRVLGVVLIINSQTIIQRTILTRRIDFKLQTRISIIANLGSGIIGVTMAYLGFGVWSLVFQTISRQFLTSLFLWIWNRWRPVWEFSVESFKELFSFGSRLLASGLLDTIYRNIYYIIIGKFFSAQELGYYTRAQMFNDLPSKNLNGIMSRVTYPVLAQVQDDHIKLKAGYKRMIKSVMLLSMILMVGLAVVAEPLIITLIGEAWRPAIVYLQMLTFIGMMYPLHALNLNMLMVQGRSDLFLRLEIIKKIIAIPNILLGIFLGVKVMIVGMWITNIFAYYLNSYWSGRFIGYTMKEQVLDILPGLGIALAMGTVVLFVGYFLDTGYLITLIVQIGVGGVITLLLCEIFKPEAYLELRHIVTNNIIKRLYEKK